MSQGLGWSARASTVTALLVSVVALTACGESAQDKAKAQVCDARSDISKQITALQGLTISTDVVNEAKGHLEAIGKDLTKIKDAQPNLEPARREQVQSATKTFQMQLSTIASDVTSSLGSGSLESGLKNAEPQLQSALRQLATDYKQALEPISCS